MKYKLKSRLLGEISIGRKAMTNLVAESEKELKSLLMRMKKRRVKKLT